MPVTVGKARYGERMALRIFDDWNRVTGALPNSSSWLYEMESIIEDAVHIGIMVATGVTVQFDDDGQLVRGTAEEPLTAPATIPWVDGPFERRHLEAVQSLSILVGPGPLLKDLLSLERALERVLGEEES